MKNDDSTRRGVLLGAGIAAIGGRAAMAQPAQQQSIAGANATAMNSARVNNGTVGVISGGVEGTYIRIAADLASVLDDGDRLRVLPVLGKGSALLCGTPRPSERENGTYLLGLRVVSHSQIR